MALGRCRRRCVFGRPRNKACPPAGWAGGVTRRATRPVGNITTARARALSQGCPRDQNISGAVQLVRSLRGGGDHVTSGMT
jgi:hypothetical protein